MQQGVLGVIRRRMDTAAWRVNRWWRQWLPGKTALAGVDIGTREIRVAKARATGAGIEIAAIGRFPTPPDAFTDGIRSEQLALALKQAVQSAGTEIDEAVTTISGDKLIVRHVRMPVMPDKEFDQAVRWEASRHIPVPLEELVLRHIRLGESGTEKTRQLHVLLVAAPLKTVHDFYNLFQQAGLRLAAIDLPAVALWRVFAGSYKVPPAGTVAVLSIGARATHFVVLQDGKLALTRTIMVGGDAVTEALAKTYGVDFSVAQRMKEEEGEILVALGEVAATTEPAQVQIDFAIRAGMGELVREIKRSLSWYQSQSRENPVQRAILCGGGAKLRGISAYLTEELGIPVDMGIPGVRVRTGGSGEGYDPSLALAIGLAVREAVG
ncbi:MAG: type IV pilus assembly protein PilM [Bacillota bacterium]|nr:type IV pilus assembly protein PilM [Thermoanaerobacteraceae bacterium]